MPESFVYNYSPVGDVCAIVICFISWLLLKSTYTVKRNNLKLFLIAKTLVFVAACSSLSFNVLISNISESRVKWIYLFKDVCYISLMANMVAFCEYIASLVILETKTRRIFNWGNRIIMLIGSIMLVICPFFQWGFYIDSKLIVHNDYHKNVFAIVYAIYLVIICAVFLIYRKRFINQMFRMLVCMLIIMVGLVFLQGKLGKESSSYLCMSFTIPIMSLLYLFHHNSYEPDTGMLDRNTFIGYLSSIAKKRFGIIYLELQELDLEKYSELSQVLIHFNEKFLNKPITFRLAEKEAAAVYLLDKNKNEEQKLHILLKDFQKMYEKYQWDYRILLIHSDEKMVSGNSYMDLITYMKTNQSINSVYRCNAKDLSDFQRLSYIKEQLIDIAKCNDYEDKRIKVYCQPVYNTETGLFSTAEALMRLELPELGMIYPDQFIPIAESLNCIHALSKIILHKTCKYIKEYIRQGYCIDRISINFSIMELRHQDFCKDILEIIEASGVEYSKIAAEVTESRNEKDFKMIKHTMNDLRRLGVCFYLDDFGTGYSNFERIMELPFDLIKFDRSLTILSGKNEESGYMVGSFSNIFNNANYTILFEGIEDANDEERCIAMHAKYLQGYKYSKPIPMEQLSNFLTKK